MDSAFAVVVIVVSCLAIVGALVAALSSRRPYDQVGKGAFALDRERAERPASASASRAEAELEIRQLVEAKSARREARGEPALDVDAEVAALLRAPEPGADAALREEVRQLVVARNERRVARGQEPLDVAAEVERQLRDLA